MHTPNAFNKMDVFFMKISIQVYSYLLSSEEHSVYYSNENQLLGVCFAWQLGLRSSILQVPKRVFNVYINLSWKKRENNFPKLIVNSNS